MFNNFQFRLALVFGAILLFTAPVAQAEKGGRHGSSGRSSHGHRGDKHGGERSYYYGSNRGYDAPNRGYYNREGRDYNSRNRYVAPYRGYNGGAFVSGRFYSGRGYFHGGSFWARPYFGIGVGIPFGYGYNTNRGCGYVDEWGDFYPAPCFSNYSYRY